MEKITLTKYNQKFFIEECHNAELKSDEIRIKTAFAGISFTDVIIRKGFYQYQKENYALPLTLGFEASGTITEIGTDVDEYSIGDRIFVLKEFGCFSEEIIAISTDLIKIPSSIPLDIAVGLGVNFFVAWHALHNIVKIFPQSNVLITSAAGGVGGMLTQIASQTNTVTGLVNSDTKFEYVTSLGAHAVFCYKNAENRGSFDIILVSSGEQLKQYQNMLTANGKIIIYGFNDLVPTNWMYYPTVFAKYITLPKINILNLVHNNQSVSGFNIIKLTNTSKEFIDTKKAFLSALTNRNFKEPNITLFNFRDVEEAFKLIESGKSIGKILLEFKG